ncbi:MAG TPA: thioredoxin [Pyrinomonadaceae bacterium]
MKSVAEVSDGTFESDVLGAERVTVVDFGATWCPPCRALEPTIEELAKKYEGRVDFLKLDIDANPSTPQRYGIKGIPTLIVFDSGRELERMVGAASKDAISRVVDKYIPAAVA